MSFTDITKPDVGDYIEKATVDALIDNDNDLNSRLSVVEAVSPANNSFEYDSDSDGIPDSWTRSLTNATLTLDDGTTDTAAHGTSHVAFGFTATTGIGTLTAEEYTPCATGQRIEASWHVYGSQAALPGRVRVLWYEDDQSYLSATTLWDETTLPTSWAKRAAQAVVPASARYFRMEIRAGDGTNGVVGQLVHFDLIDTRVYHGSVYLDVDTPISLSTATTTGAHTISVAEVSPGERPVKAYIGWSGTVAAGDTLELTFTGDGVDVAKPEYDNGGSGFPLAVQTTWASQLWVPLDENGEFTMTIGDDDPTAMAVELFGYEV